MRFRTVLSLGIVVLLLVCGLSTRILAQDGRPMGHETTHACASESDELGQLIGRHLDQSVRKILTDSALAQSRAELGLLSTTSITSVTDTALCARIVAALDGEERRGRANAGKPVWVRQVGPYFAVADAIATAGEWATLWILDPDFRVRQRWAF